MTRRQVLIEEKVTLAATRYLDDPAGLAEVLDAIDALADNPRPPGSVPYGPTVCRLHIGAYRVMYEITDTEIKVGHIARIL